MNGKVLEEVDQFKYLGFTETNDGTIVKGSKDQTAGAGTLSHLVPMTFNASLHHSFSF